MPVYFIAENEKENYDRLRIKIGISKNIGKRLNQLQTGSPYELRLMGWIESDEDRNLEKHLHKKFAASRSHGEWFTLSANDIFDELKCNSARAYIALNEDAFEIESYDQDGIPEYVGSWQWGDPAFEEFCPNCGWGGGMDYNENYGGLRCLSCGFMESYFETHD